MRYGRVDWMALAALGLLSSVLLLTRLDGSCLWQDEAQTAVIARTVLSVGIPLGSDGRNSFSQERGIEYGDDHVWRWHTWLSFYLVAGSFALLGATTYAARLPFALLGVATVLLCYAAGRRLWEDRLAAGGSAGMLSLCVPYLVLQRQCRWYGAATFFSLLGLVAYTRIGGRERRHSLLLFAAATLLFHTHYLYAATLLLALLVHALVFRREQRERFSRAVAVAAAVVVFNAPWILWFSGVRYAENYAERLLDPVRSLVVLAHLCGDFFRFFLHPVLLAAPIGVLAIAAYRGRASRQRVRRASLELAFGSRYAVSLLVCFCVANVLLLALLAPGAYFRYIAPLAPPAFLLAGRMLAGLWVESRVAAAVVAGLWLTTLSLPRYAYELTHDFDGPIDGIVRFLTQHARPGDTVAISAGDMPLKFYTELRVIGGLTGEDLDEAAGADWIILRRHAFTPFEREVRAALAAHLDPEAWVAHPLDVPDTAFENREDPRFHRFRTAPAQYPRVVVHGRRRTSREGPEDAPEPPPSSPSG